MKPLIPILFVSMLFTQAVSAATFNVEQIDLSELQNQSTVSLIKAGGKLGVFSHSNDTGSSANFIYKNKSLLPVEFNTSNTTSSSVVYFNHYAYIKLYDQVWRTPTNRMNHWRKVQNVGDHTSPIMKIGGKLAMYASSGNGVWISSNGKDWALKTMTGKPTDMGVIADTVVSKTSFQDTGYMVMAHYNEATLTDIHLFSSTNGKDWSETATTVFNGETSITDVGAFFKWDNVLYMLTTDANGLTQWWKSGDGAEFTTLDWDIPANTARILYKDSENIVLSTTESGVIGGKIWQYEVGGVWQENTDIGGINDVGFASNYYTSGIHYKKAWYSLGELYNSDLEKSDFTLLKITKQ